MSDSRTAANQEPRTKNQEPRTKNQEPTADHVGVPAAEPGTAAPRPTSTLEPKPNKKAMKTHIRSTLTIPLLAVTLSSVTQAAIISSGFSGSSSLAVTTTNMADWGYFSGEGANSGIFLNTSSNTLFEDMASGIPIVSGSPYSGDVTISETGVNPKDNQSVVVYNFDGDNAVGAYGDLAGAESDAWSVTFNDLGIGTQTITLYMGHTSTDRVFDMDVSLTDGGAPVTTTDTSAAIGTYGGAASGRAFRYDITVATTTASADLTLTFGSVSGGAGQAYWAGYTATPEPSSTALLGLGGLALMLRRKRS